MRRRDLVLGLLGFAAPVALLNGPRLHCGGEVEGPDLPGCVIVRNPSEGVLELQLVMGDGLSILRGIKRLPPASIRWPSFRRPS